jgi:tetratricopeptide (TPR) repeat protein
MPAFIATQLRHASIYRDVGIEAEALHQNGGDELLRGLQVFDSNRTQIEAAFEALADRFRSGKNSRHEIVAGPNSSQIGGGKNVAELLISLVSSVAFIASLRLQPRQRIRWLEFQRDAAILTSNRSAEAQALGNLGIAYRQMGDAQKALAYQVARLAIARESFDRGGEGVALGNLGLAHWSLGDAKEAIKYLEQSLSILRETGDRHGENCMLGNLANAYGDLGEHQKAVDAYKAALVIDREIGDRRGEGSDLGNLGVAYLELGDLAKAMSSFEMSLEIALAIGNHRGQGYAFFNTALAFYAMGNFRQALVSGKNALVILDEIEDPSTVKIQALLAKWKTEQDG